MKLFESLLISLFIVGLLLLPVRALYPQGMTILNSKKYGVAFVQAVSIQGTSGAASRTTAAITVTAGNLLFACANNDTGHTATITSSVSQTWNSILNKDNGANVQSFYAMNVAGGSSTFTSTSGSGADFQTLVVVEVSGAATASALDKNIGATGSSNSPSSGVTATRSQPDEILLGCFGTPANSTQTSSTAGTNWAFQTGSIQLSANGAIVAVETQIVSATGTDAAVMNWQNSDAWGAIVQGFKAGP